MLCLDWFQGGGSCLQSVDFSLFRLNLAQKPQSTSLVSIVLPKAMWLSYKITFKLLSAEWMTQINIYLKLDVIVGTITWTIWDCNLNTRVVRPLGFPDKVTETVISNFLLSFFPGTLNNDDSLTVHWSSWKWFVIKVTLSFNVVFEGNGLLTKVRYTAMVTLLI